MQLRGRVMQSYLLWVVVDNWCIGKKEMSSSSRVKDSMVHWGLNVLIHYVVVSILCAVGVHKI